MKSRRGWGSPAPGSSVPAGDIRSTTQSRERPGRKLDQMTGGNKDTQVVVFCFDAHCWLSYNTTLRIVRLDYHNVLWYRGGREAGNAAGLPLVQLPREPW
jgi:hypothetical protein